MMKSMRTCVWCISLALTLSPAADGAEFFLVPISASGTHTINGVEIVLTGGGQRVFLEVRLADWDPGGGAITA